MSDNHLPRSVHAWRWVRNHRRAVRWAVVVLLMGIWATGVFDDRVAITVGLLAAAFFIAGGGWLLQRGQSYDQEEPLEFLDRGPTDEEILSDPTYNAYPENVFHKHFHNKN